MADVVVFGSGHKGGTGKSVLSSLTAYALATQGKRVLLVDLGEYGSSTNLTLESDPGPPYISDYFMGRATWREVIVESSCSPNLWVAPGSKQQGPIDAQCLEYLIDSAGRQVNYVIIDLPSYPGTLLDPVVTLADIIVLVTNPDKLSVMAVKSWYSTRAFARSKLGIPVLNKYHVLMHSWLDKMREEFGVVFPVSFDPALTFTFTDSVSDAYRNAGKRTREEIRLLTQRINKPLLKVTG
jgi:cellulose biosynthesis protein BcsQ